MADLPNSITDEHSANPYAPPTHELADPWNIGDPGTVALRRAHRRDEAHVKALSIANFVYGLLFAWGAYTEIKILIDHLTGQASAPWILLPARLAMIVFETSMPIAALAAAFGFFRRRRWALWFELTFVACWFMMQALEPLIRSAPRPALEFIGLMAANIALAAPMLSAWKLRGSGVFDPQYSDAILATPHIRIRPKLSLRLTLTMIVLFLVGAVLVILSQRFNPT
jgi:hypothetical protein